MFWLLKNQICKNMRNIQYSAGILQINIPYPGKHPTSWTSHIHNILHPQHPISRTSHIPNIPHPKHPTSPTSYIFNIPHLQYPITQDTTSPTFHITSILSSFSTNFRIHARLSLNIHSTIFKFKTDAQQAKSSTHCFIFYIVNLFGRNFQN